MNFKIVSVELEGKNGQPITTTKLAEVIGRSLEAGTQLSPRFHDHGEISPNRMDLEIISEGVTIRAGQQTEYVWIEISTPGRMTVSRKLLVESSPNQIAIDVRTSTQTGQRGQEIAHRIVAFAYQPKA